MRRVRPRQVRTGLRRLRLPRSHRRQQVRIGWSNALAIFLASIVNLLQIRLSHVAASLRRGVDGSIILRSACGHVDAGRDQRAQRDVGKGELAKTPFEEVNCLDCPQLELASVRLQLPLRRVQHDRPDEGDQHHLHRLSRHPLLHRRVQQRQDLAGGPEVGRVFPRSGVS